MVTFLHFTSTDDEQCFLRVRYSIVLCYYSIIITSTDPHSLYNNPKNTLIIINNLWLMVKYSYAHKHVYIQYTQSQTPFDDAGNSNLEFSSSRKPDL